MKIVNGIQVLEFISEGTAFTERSLKPMCILLGDASHYWVGTLADAQRLMELGYEMLD